MRQAVFFLIGFITFIVVSKISFRQFQTYAHFGYYVLLMLLLLLFIIGRTTKGIYGWFDIGFGLKFQPSQLAIPIVSLYLSKIIDFKQKVSLDKFLYYLLIIAIPGLLILIQPDMGTAVIYFISIFILLLFAKVPKSYFLTLGLAGVIITLIGWQWFLKPYQKIRLTSFVTTSQIETDANYNARQSLIAVGSGQIIGRGLGRGVQSHLRFLPERQTDFIFASFAEEWGFIGSFFVVLLYFILVTYIFYNSYFFSSFNNSVYGYVVGVMIFVQAGINIGMNIGLLPITGITLPLLSYGGSSLVSIMLMLGIFQSIIENNANNSRKFLRFF